VGVAPIVRIDHRLVKDGTIGPVTRAIQQLYFDATRGNLQAYSDWLTPIYQSRMKHERELASVAR
jgi:branched-chain amino acid aminotransferase